MSVTKRNQVTTLKKLKAWQTRKAEKQSTTTSLNWLFSNCLDLHDLRHLSTMCEERRRKLFNHIFMMMVCAKIKLYEWLMKIKNKL